MFYGSREAQKTERGSPTLKRLAWNVSTHFLLPEHACFAFTGVYLRFLSEFVFLV